MQISRKQIFHNFKRDIKVSYLFLLFERFFIYVKINFSFANGNYKDGRFLFYNKRE